jgi:hypothetical protein
MIDDELAEVRRIRREISEQCGHDVHRVAAYYREIQNELKESGEFRFSDSQSPAEIGESEPRTCSG